MAVHSFFKHTTWHQFIYWMLLLLPFLISADADRVGTTKAGVLYVVPNQPDYCLTPWMDIFEDPAGTLVLNDHTIADDGHRPTRNEADGLNFGVSNTVFWLRFRVALSSEATGGGHRLARILDLGAAYTDRVTWSLYDGKGKRMAAGGSREDQDAFALLELTPEPQNYYLKVQSTTALLMHPRLYTWKAYLDHNRQKMIWFGLFAGIILAVGVYNLSIYISFRDSSYLWYVLHLLFVLLYFLGINGLTGTYLLPGRPEVVGMLDRSFLGLLTAFIALITRSFLMSRSKTPVIDRVIVSLFVLACIIALTNLLFQARLVVILLILLGILVPSVMALASWKALRDGFKPARLFMIAWGLDVIAVVFFALTNSGVIAFTGLGFHGFQIGSAIAAILLSISLGDRIRTLRRERDLFKKSMEQVTMILDSIDSGVFLIESGTQLIREVNPAAAKLIGRRREEIIGNHRQQFIHRVEVGHCPAPEACECNECRQERVIHASGVEIPVLKQAKQIQLDGHNLILESFVDISDLKQAEAAVRQSEAKFRSLFESSRDAVIILEKQQFMECNQAALEMFGCTSELELLNRRPADHSPPCQPSGVDSETQAQRHWEAAMKAGSHFFEWHHKRADGEVFPAEVMLSAVAFEGKTVLQALVRDISQRKAMEEELKRLASTDPLTGADNRRSFWSKGAMEMLRSRRHNRSFALLMVDVDHFKAVNDTYGHHTGDLVLKALVAHSTKNLRATDLFGRLGGEEFAILLPETEADNAIEFGERLRRELSRITVASDKGPVGFTVSIGLSLFEEKDDTLESIMGRADSALYVAKQSGRNRLVRG